MLNFMWIVIYNANFRLDHDPYIQKETIQAGEDINQTYSHGSVVRVSCTHGFGVNLPNETIKCVQGRWKPKLPQCSACTYVFTLMRIIITKRN